jgi:hypothetical protein
VPQFRLLQQIHGTGGARADLKSRISAADTYESLLQTPTYPFGEAAHYLNVPATLLRTWCVGRRGSKSMIRLDGKQSEGLSFLNLIEAHVLSAIPWEHCIPSPKTLLALQHASKLLDVDRPLAQAQFATRGVGLFVKTLDGIHGASSHELRAMSWLRSPS